MSPIGGINQGGYQPLYGKVASGKALQNAADGAAELAISEKMSWSSCSRPFQKEAR